MVRVHQKKPCCQALIINEGRRISEDNHSHRELNRTMINKADELEKNCAIR